MSLGKTLHSSPTLSPVSVSLVYKSVNNSFLSCFYPDLNVILVIVPLWFSPGIDLFSLCLAWFGPGLDLSI